MYTHNASLVQSSIERTWTINDIIKLKKGRHASFECPVREDPEQRVGVGSMAEGIGVAYRGP